MDLERAAWLRSCDAYREPLRFRYVQALPDARWNFVASSQERIEAAKEAWRKADRGKGRFDLPPDDRDEFIPAPEK